MEEGNKGTVRHIQTVQDPVVLRSFRGHEKTTFSVDFDPQMRQLASGGADGLVYVYSFKPQGRAFKFVGHQGAVYAVAFSPDGNIVASSGEDRTIKLWKNNVYGKCNSIKGHVGSVRSLSFSKDSQIIVSGSDDKTVKGWNVPKHKFLFSLPGHTNWVRSAKLAPDSRLVVSGSDDCSVRLWDVETSKEVHRFKESTAGVYAVDWITDGTSVCAGTQNGRINLWDVRSMKLIQHYEASDKPINSIDVHASGAYLLTGNEDSSIKIFDLRQGRLAWSLFSHKGPVRHVTFNSVGDYFASCGQDSTCLVWKTNFDEFIKASNVVTFVENVDPMLHSQVGSSYAYSAGGAITQTKFKANKPYPYQVEVRQEDKENIQVNKVQYKTPKERKSEVIAEALSSRFEKIVSQMDRITNLIQSLEVRITNNEEEIRKLNNNPKARRLLEQYEQIFTESQHKNAVWESFRTYKQYYQEPPPKPQSNIEHIQQSPSEPVFETGSFMRRELVEDFPEDSERKLQEEYDQERQSSEFTITKIEQYGESPQLTMNYTNTNPFQQAMASTFNQQTVQQTFSTRVNLQDQLGNLGEWRTQLEELQKQLEDVNQQPDYQPYQQEQVIREEEEGEVEDAIDQQQGSQIYLSELDEQGNQGEENQGEEDQFYQTAQLGEEHQNQEYIEIHDEGEGEEEEHEYIQEQGLQNEDY